MMKHFYLIILFPIFIASAYGQNHTYVHVRSKTNFSAKADSILNIALPLIDSVINTSTFRDGILNAFFLGNGNFSNAEILSLILTGREVHAANANDTIDLLLETYPNQSGDNIGTTYNSKRIVSSESYILRNGPRCYAAHVIHEYCHTIGRGAIGFEHRHRVFSKKQRRQKCQSVPYIVGDLARQILKVKTCQCECEDWPQS